MLDLETLGNKPGSVIVAIGAVKFGNDEILDRFYGHGPQDAYPGDEDQGQMSAWFVMAAMGLFQTDGGCRTDPVYELGSPLYPKVVLHLDAKHYSGKTFTIEAKNASRSNSYIQSARLNARAASH